MIRQGLLKGIDPRRGRLPLPQGDQEGRRQGDVQDGHQHHPELPRRPDLRGHRPERGVRRPLLRQDGLADRRRRPGGDRPRDARAPPPRLRHPRRRPAACSRKGASTSGGATASTTCSTPRRSSGSSTPPRPAATTSSRSTPRMVDEQNERLCTLRGLFEFRLDHCTPVPIEEVEPVESIVKRFATGAMSYGSISAEAHETLAIAMNRLGGQIEHRRRGRGPRAVQALAQRRQQAKRDQAGGLGPVRRDQRVPGQRRRAPDQDGPGGQARRGGPASRPQGLALDRQGPVLDARASA